jgi:hypothetical protein
MPPLRLSDPNSSLKSPQPVGVVPHGNYVTCPVPVSVTKQESEPKEQLRYAWLLEFSEASKSTFVFNIP